MDKFSEKSLLALGDYYVYGLIVPFTQRFYGRLKRRMKTILCYGDSNTYGYNPVNGFRYPEDVRWTGRLKKLLGDEYRIIEEGCNGRTTIFDDPVEGWKNGMDYLRPCLNSHKPVDLVIMMLGTNDLKRTFHASAREIADGAGALVQVIQSFTSLKQGFEPKIILVSPPEIGEGIRTSDFFGSFDVDAIDRSREFAECYQKVAKKYGCIFLDAAKYVQPSVEDAVHLTEQGHLKLAEALCRVIQYHEAAGFLQKRMHELDYPKEHPFWDYPDSPDSGFFLNLILMTMSFGTESSMMNQILKKCKSVEKGKFDFNRYVQNIDEVIVLFYVYFRRLLHDPDCEILYEPKGLIQNDKKLEYSLWLKKEKCLVNFEVKSMLCDPFYKEESLPIQDGTVLIKQFLNDMPEYKEAREKYPEAVELLHSSYYTPFKNNIRKISEKFAGEKQCDMDMIQIGVIIINFSTSMDEFYTCLFHWEKGMYSWLREKNLDALVLFSLDAKNDILMENVYQMGYIQTVLLKDRPKTKTILEQIGLDHYICVGEEIDPEVYDQAQKTYGLYQIFNRGGFINIIPFDTSEEEKEKYLSYLEGDKVRYDDFE